ncbi:hypothetical protein [Krasilnikovia sp. MM14-A1004]|uniref:hypothetical protein n=1 Tax=Krasilnikovia sp. MM14-A1004 TaxID=3373541 RepID=UPI00399CCF4C
MILTRFRRSAPLLMAAGTLVAVLTPGVALADGPGYGGTADALTVQWQGAQSRDGLAVYAVGFRAGSSVAVRVGSSPDRKVATDAFGGLRVLMVAAGATAPAEPATGTAVVAVDTPSGGKLSSGTVVQAIGQTPAGSVRTLVGAVPPPAAAGGAHTLIPWAGFAAVLVGIGVLMRRLRPARAATAGDVRGHRYAPRHRG